MPVVINGTTGITAAAFDGAVDAADLTGDVAAARITTALNATGTAPIYACRAWVNFDGTGTVAIRSSGNVSSITDNGTGDYSINFTTAMPDANYCAVGNGATLGTAASASAKGLLPISYSTTSVRVVVVTGTGSANDYNAVNVAVFR